MISVFGGGSFRENQMYESNDVTGNFDYTRGSWSSRSRRRRGSETSRSDIYEALDAYEADFGKLSAHGDYPSPQALRSVVKQGATSSASTAGYASTTEGGPQAVGTSTRR